ncbi:hypothetical protein EH32_10525 [Erythrobacter litoralis]|uniref:Glycosyltransferase 2-like domain-containing protein n=2 Tax=Erythrobacter litoralis TaxID=39960 RepID=A0A074MNX3_9SPHN|nr:hypothetical protein EH32_10525 [Erythrobacter litoralis]
MFEVICIDDCTPDGSAAIVEQYVRKDPRVRSIKHETNLGLGGARNSGIRAAQADFIASVDSDDSMKPTMLEVLWEASENGFYDIVVCGFDRVDEAGTVLSTQHSGDKTIVNDGDIDIFNAMNPAFWNKLWRKSLFTEHDIWFPEHLYYQDTATTPRILTKARHLRFIQDSLYNYLVRPDSISTTASPKHLIDYFKVFDLILSFLEDEGIDDKFFDSFLDYIDRGIAHHAHMGAMQGLSDEDQTQYLRHLLAFKTGYIEHRALVRQKSKSELLPLLEKARTKSDLLPPDGRPILPLSVIVKTFLRPQILERFLLSVGHYEQRRGVRFSEILVGDDSPAVEVAANERAIKKARDFYPHLNIHHHVYEENIGLSDGRNRLVKEAREDFILLCDDDFILDEDADIPAALGVAKEGKYQLVGGWLKNNYNQKDGSFSYWGAYGKISETDEEVIININEQAIGADDLFESEYLLNFFLADRACLIANPWDNSLKVEEHQEFFYRLKGGGFKAALFGPLFVKHTADRSANPARYNDYRFAKTNWERYLFEAPMRMGKKRRTINRCRHDTFERWTVDAVERSTIQNTVQLKEGILAQAVPVTCISPSFQQHFGGYYDILLTSNDGRYALCQSASATDRLPRASDVADIVLIDKHNDNATRILGQTSAWCHQQGAHAQFIPGVERQIIYNVYDEEIAAFASIEVNVDTGEQRPHPLPISALSPDGVTAASLNFSRLFDYRPGYGYCHIPDPFADENAPAMDGLWLFDLTTGSKMLILSYEKIRDFLTQEGFDEVSASKLVLNHVAFNTDGSKVLALLRIFSDDAPFPTFTLVCDRNGSNLRRVFGFCSHYHWKDAQTLVMSGGEGMTRKTVGQINVFEINVETGECVQIGPGALCDDGHCSYSPDRQYLLYDSYCNNAFPYRRLMIYRLSDGRAVDLGYFYSPGKWFNNNPDLRTDLHPRWSPDGETISFDSIHEGFRGVYSIKVSDAIAALESPLSRFSKQDLMMWYSAKYGSESSLKPKATHREVEQNASHRADDQTWRNFDRIWLLSMVLAHRAHQSPIALKRIPAVNSDTPLVNLARIAKKHRIELVAPESFDELRYIDENPDVSRAVEAGRFRSGYEHYVLNGHLEGRKRATV